MTQEEILKKAIEKAESNGYLLDGYEPSKCTWWMECFMVGHYTEFDIIFSHDFAKAFWGEKPFGRSEYVSDNDFEEYEIEVWQYHLQQMVLEENPIDYLKRGL